MPVSPESYFSFLSFQVNVDDTIEMLPKSRRALTIQEIAALARSSLHGEYNIKQTKNTFKKNMLQHNPELSPCRYFPGSEGPCDKADSNGSGQSGPSDRVERLV